MTILKASIKHYEQVTGEYELLFSYNERGPNGSNIYGKCCYVYPELAAFSDNLCWEFYHCIRDLEVTRPSFAIFFFCWVISQLQISLWE